MVPATQTTGMSDDVWTGATSAALNARVKAYNPPKNAGTCGTDYKYNYVGTTSLEIIMKNTCEFDMLITEHTITLP